MTNAKYVINDELIFSMNTKETHLNNNIALVGSPGSGKTHLNSYNLSKMLDRSHVIVDVKGSMSGFIDYFENHGYKTYHFDLMDLDNSDGYSIFRYINPSNKELDIQTISNTLYGACYSRDPYWDNAAKKLLNYMLTSIYDTFDQNHRSLSKFEDYMYIFGTYLQDEERIGWLVDELLHCEKILRLCKRAPNSRSNIMTVFNNSPRTLKCIIDILNSALLPIMNQKVYSILSKDEIRFDNFLNKKVCLVITINDADNTLHKVCGLLITQLLQFLFRKALNYPNQSLPIPIQFHLDDFGSYYIDNFESIIATARSRNIGITCLYQSYAQLQKNYHCSAETITQCFDTILFFGGIDEYSTNLIARQTGYTTTYISSQKVHTCFVYRRGLPAGLHNVKILSDFIIPTYHKKKEKKIFHPSKKYKISFDLTKLYYGIMNGLSDEECEPAYYIKCFMRRKFDNNYHEVALSISEIGRLYVLLNQEKSLKNLETLYKCIQYLNVLSSLYPVEAYNQKMFRIKVTIEEFDKLSGFLKRKCRITDEIEKSLHFNAFYKAFGIDAKQERT